MEDDYYDNDDDNDDVVDRSSGRPCDDNDDDNYDDVDDHSSGRPDNDNNYDDDNDDNDNDDDHCSWVARHLGCPDHGAERPGERAAAVGGPGLQLHLLQPRVQAAGHQVVL